MNNSIRNNNHYLLEKSTSFETLCNFTLTICGIKEFPLGTFTETGNAWVELVKAWDSLLPCGSYGIFEEAVHRIMWGIPTCQSKLEYEDLISAVISELLADGDAFAAWDTCAGFETAIGYVTSEMTPLIEDGDEYNLSIEHYHYVSDKAILKIRYSKAKYVSEDPGYEEEIIAYETAIKRIVPSSVTWCEEDWFNESRVFDELLKLYGIDYREDFVEYGRILLILMNYDKEEFVYNLKEAWFASNIKRMPMSLAKIIWPEDTKDKITELFLWASEAAEIQETSGMSDENKKRKKSRNTSCRHFRIQST